MDFIKDNLSLKRFKKMNWLIRKSPEEMKKEEMAQRVNWLLTFLAGVSMLAMICIGCAILYVSIQPIDELSTGFLLKISLLNTLLILLVFILILWNAFQKFLGKKANTPPLGLEKVSSGFQLMVTGLGLEVADTVGLGLLGLSGPLAVVVVGGIASICMTAGIFMCSSGVVSLFRNGDLSRA